MLLSPLSVFRVALFVCTLVPRLVLGYDGASGYHDYGCRGADHYSGQKCTSFEGYTFCREVYTCERGDAVPDLQRIETDDGYGSWTPHTIHFENSALHGDLTLQPSSVKVLHVNNNLLTGTLHADSLSQAALVEFITASNKLTGTIPAVNAANLITLNLSSNRHTGTIPSLNAPKLRNLNLSINQLTGTIPSFTQLPHLQNFYLSRNQLTGTIPSLAGVPLLQRLDLSHNQLKGWLPSTAHLAPFAIALNDNQLTGTVPGSFGANLHKLHLYNNRFVGTTPWLPVSVDLQVVGNNWECFLRLRSRTNNNGGWPLGTFCSYSVWHGIRIQGQSLLKNYPGSLDRCAMMCGKTAGCAAWTYNHKWHWCQLYDQPYAQPLQSAQGYSVGLPPPQRQCALNYQVDCHGDDITNFGNVASEHDCCDHCHATSDCKFWTYNRKRRKCWVKRTCDDPRHNADVVGGATLA